MTSPRVPELVLLPDPAEAHGPGDQHGKCQADGIDTDMLEASGGGLGEAVAGPPAGC